VTDHDDRVYADDAAERATRERELVQAVMKRLHLTAHQRLMLPSVLAEELDRSETG
jgi:hypothetical protein